MLRVVVGVSFSVPSPQASSANGSRELGGEGRQGAAAPMHSDPNADPRSNVHGWSKQGAAETQCHSPGVVLSAGKPSRHPSALPQCAQTGSSASLTKAYFKSFIVKAANCSLSASSYVF